jgi:hypothetical protein
MVKDIYEIPEQATDMKHQNIAGKIKKRIRN